MIRRRFLSTAIALVLGGAVGAGAAQTPGPAAFIDETGRRAVEALTEPGLAEAERAERFREIFREVFDVEAIARFALGRYWRAATEEQRREYVELFEIYVVGVYAGRFGEYEGEGLTVVGTREDDGEHIVHSEISVNRRPPARVDWRLRPDDGGFKIIDVRVEGISMTITQRDEFVSVIRNGGGQVEALLRALRQRARR